LDTQASRTALWTAVARGQHRRLHERPWVFDDPYGLALAGPSWPALWQWLVEVLPERGLRETVAATVARARYAEDQLRHGEFDQYVILGAGLDSFAWRWRAQRPLRVFEVDHPASQAWKRERAASLGLPEQPWNILVPVDFESQTPLDELKAAGLDTDVPTLFSWLGVLPYLSVDAIEDTLRLVSACAPGSRIAFDYIESKQLWTRDTHELMGSLAALAAEGGEPLRTCPHPSELEALVRRCGLRVSEHRCPAEIRARYFGGRRDGLRPFSNYRLVTATAEAPR
jgi:methyltransferase (TIGR00027 family)